MQLIDFAEELADQFEDIAYTERKLVVALPRIVQTTSAAELRETFATHLRETKLRVARLGALYRRLDLQHAGCSALDVLESGPVEEGVADAAALTEVAERIERYQRSANRSIGRFTEILANQPDVSLAASEA